MFDNTLITRFLSYGAKIDYRKNSLIRNDFFHACSLFIGEVYVRNKSFVLSEFLC